MRITWVLLAAFPAGLLAQAVQPQAAQPQPEHYKDTLFSPGAAPDAPALSGHDKLQIHLERMVWPRVFVGALFVAGLQQARDTHADWGRGIDGFGKRYGTDLGVNAMREALAEGIDVLTHQDPRFFRSQSSGFGPRLRDALLQVIWAHTDSGGRAPAYGTVLSAYGSAEAAVRWVPPSQSSTGDGLFYGSILLAGDAGRNVFREFWPDIKRRIHRR